MSSPFAARAEDKASAAALIICAKWSKLSKQELSALKTNDELVAQLVTKHDIEKIAAQRDVDVLMAGCNLTA